MYVYIYIYICMYILCVYMHMYSYIYIYICMHLLFAGLFVCIDFICILISSLFLAGIHDRRTREEEDK